MPAVRWVTAKGPVRLLEALAYRANDGREFVVPVGQETDLESRPLVLPGLVNWILGDALETALAAILHDAAYRRTLLAIGGEPARLTRAEADALYYEALRSTGNGRVSAWLGWAGLRVGGWFAWSSK